MMLTGVPGLRRFKSETEVFVASLVDLIIASDEDSPGGFLAGWIPRRFPKEMTNESAFRAASCCAVFGLGPMPSNFSDPSITTYKKDIMSI